MFDRNASIQAMARVPHPAPFRVRVLPSSSESENQS